jgi:hypothetical protein
MGIYFVEPKAKTILNKFKQEIMTIQGDCNRKNHARTQSKFNSIYNQRTKELLRAKVKILGHLCLLMTLPKGNINVICLYGKR